MNETVRARLYLVILILGWGVTWSTMKIALEDIPPFSMRVCSLSVGAATVLAVLLLQGRSLRIGKPRTWGHLCVASLINIVSFSVFTPYAQLSAATSRVAIVVYTMPIWACLIAWPVLGERIDRVRALALVLCVAGMTILIYPLTALGVPTGILLALAAGVSWAAGTVYLKWAKLDGDPFAITFWQLAFALLIIAVCLPVVEGSLQVSQASTRSILAMIFSGMVGSGLSYFLWFDIVQRLPASTASLGILAVPAIGVLSSMIILGERPTLDDLIGFALMFSASACVLLWPNAPRTT